MAKQLKEIRGFGKGIANSVSPEDMPDSASPYSKNVHPHSAHGILKGIPEDKTLIAGESFTKGPTGFKNLGNAQLNIEYLEDIDAISMAYSGDDHVLVDDVTFTLTDVTYTGGPVILPIGDGVNNIIKPARSTTSNANSSEYGYSLNTNFAHGKYDIECSSGHWNTKKHIFALPIHNYPKIHWREDYTSVHQVITASTNLSFGIKIWTDDVYGTSTKVQLNLYHLDELGNTIFADTQYGAWEWLNQAHTEASPLLIEYAQTTGELDISGINVGDMSQFRLSIQIEVDDDRLPGWATNLPLGWITTEYLPVFSVYGEEYFFNYNEYQDDFIARTTWNNYPVEHAGHFGIENLAMFFGNDHSYQIAQNASHKFRAFKEDMSTSQLGSVHMFIGNTQIPNVTLPAWGTHSYTKYENGNCRRVDMWLIDTSESANCMPVYSEKFELDDGRPLNAENGEISGAGVYPAVVPKTLVGHTAFDTYYNWQFQGMDELRNANTTVDFSAFALSPLGTYNHSMSGGAPNWPDISPTYFLAGYISGGSWFGWSTTDYNIQNGWDKIPYTANKHIPGYPYPTYKHYYAPLTANLGPTGSSADPWGSFETSNAPGLHIGSYNGYYDTNVQLKTLTPVIHSKVSGGNEIYEFTENSGQASESLLDNIEGIHRIRFTDTWLPVGMIPTTVAELLDTYVFGIEISRDTTVMGNVGEMDGVNTFTATYDSTRKITKYVVTFDDDTFVSQVTDFPLGGLPDGTGYVLKVARATGSITNPSLLLETSYSPFRYTTGWNY